MLKLTTDLTANRIFSFINHYVSLVHYVAYRFIADLMKNHALKTLTNILSSGATTFSEGTVNIDMTQILPRWFFVHFKRQNGQIIDDNRYQWQII